MSRQALDIVRYRQGEFYICGATPRLPFAIKDVGWKPCPRDTGDQRGYFCEYEVIGGHLRLTKADIGVEEAVWKQARKGKQPTLLGASPELKHYTSYLWGIPILDKIPFRSVDRQTLIFHPDEPVSFTGGLLVGRQLAEAYGLIPNGYCFAEVWELVFEAGKLNLEADRSQKMGQIRALRQEQRENKTRRKKEQEAQSTPSTALSEEDDIARARWDTFFHLRYAYW